MGQATEAKVPPGLHCASWRDLEHGVQHIIAAVLVKAISCISDSEGFGSEINIISVKSTTR